MLATLYNVAVDLPLQESAWWLAFLWFCRCLYLFSYIRCYCCDSGVDPCAQCTSSTPDQLQVVINAFSDGTCADCDEGYNGTFVLDWNQNAGIGCGGIGDIYGDGTAALGNCQWTYVVSPVCGNISRLSATVRGGGFGLRVFFWNLNPPDVFCNNAWVWMNTPASAPDFDCASWSSYSVAANVATDGVCLHDDSAALVTSL
jgi:hypothetical protein